MSLMCDGHHRRDVAPVGEVAAKSGWIADGCSFVLIGLVRTYQFFLSPFLGGRCRFEPSCSEYFIGAVRKHGPLWGALRGICRLCRCHPLCRGGYDPP